MDARGDPALVIGRQPSSRHDAVQVGVRLQGLSPGVQDAEKSDLRAEMFGIGSYFQQGGGSGSEQEMIKLPRVVLRQEVEFVGNGEDHVKVRGGQQFLFPRGKPTLARLGLALGAVPIATRNGELSITCLVLNRCAVGAA